MFSLFAYNEERMPTSMRKMKKRDKESVYSNAIATKMAPTMNNKD